MAGASRARRPRRDGEATRAAILDAARRLFAARGYRRTTVRAIGAAAGADPALVVRYFDGKQGLLAQVLRHGIDRSRREFTDLLRGVPPGRRGRLVVQRQLAMAARLDAPARRERLELLVRSLDETPALRHAEAWVDREFLDVLADGVDGADRELRLALVQAQLMGLTLARDVIGLPALRDARAEQIAQHLGAAVQQVLGPPRRPRRPTPPAPAARPGSPSATAPPPPGPEPTGPAPTRRDPPGPDPHRFAGDPPG